MKRAAVLVLLLSGCPEADFDRDFEDAGTTDSADAMDVDASEPDAGEEEDAGMDDAGPPPDVPFDGGPPDPSIEGLVINEIDPDGEWIELYNGRSTPIALGGYRICDSEDDGSPRLDRAAAFPADFALEPAEYLIVVEVDEPELEVISTTCPFGDRCLHTGFGLSAGNGDTIFLLDEGDGVALSATLPPDAVEGGQSYCRFPNATGDFTPCPPTPESSNVVD